MTNYQFLFILGVLCLIFGEDAWGNDAKAPGVIGTILGLLLIGSGISSLVMTYG